MSRPKRSWWVGVMFYLVLAAYSGMLAYGVYGWIFL